MNKFNENGLKHGPWKGYYSNGNLYYTENYVNGELHGKHESYWMNGSPMIKSNYNNGKQVGYFENFFDDEKLNLKRYYL